MSAAREHSDDEIRFAADDALQHERPQSDIEEQIERLAQMASSPPSKPSQEPTQFSLRFLLACVTLAAIGLASTTWLPGAIVTGVLGGVTLLVFIFSLSGTSDAPALRALCTGLLVLYLSAAAGTLFRSLAGGP